MKRMMMLILILIVPLSAVRAQSEPRIVVTPFVGPRVQFSPDGQLLAVFEDGALAVALELEPNAERTAVLLLDAVTGEQRASLSGARDFTGSLLFSADSARLHLLLINGELITWDVASGALLSEAHTPLIGSQALLFQHPATGELAASWPNMSHTSYVSLNYQSGATTLLTTHPLFATYTEFMAAQRERGPMMFNDIAVVPFAAGVRLTEHPLAGDELWVADTQGRVGLLSLGTGEVQVLVEGSDRPMLNIRELTVTENGLLAFADQFEDTLYVFDLINQTTSEFDLEHDWAVLSPDGTRFAQYNADGTAILLTPLAEGSALMLPVPAGEMLRPLMRLRFSPDGMLLAATGPGDLEGEGDVLLYHLEG